MDTHSFCNSVDHTYNDLEERRGVAFNNDRDYDAASEDEQDSFLDSYSASVSSSPSSDSVGYLTERLPVSLHWFRCFSLRLHDNPALMASLSQPQTQFRAVFVLDPWFTESDCRFGTTRLKFLLECLHDLSNQLEALGLRLYIAQGQTTAVLASLCQEWGVTYLSYQKSQEPRSKVEERTIHEMASMMNIKVEEFHNHTLYSPDDLLQINEGKPVLTFKEFRILLSKLKPPPAPIPGPSLKQRYIEDSSPMFVAQKFQIPSLASLGCDDIQLGTGPWVGGESEVLKRLDTYCATRSKPFNRPIDCLFDKTSLSPYVRFGCLSVRHFWHYVRKLAATDKSKLMLVQDVSSKLLQREFYFLVSSQVPNFDTDKQNPLCIQLPWDYDAELLRRWKAGMTGYPWIDAGIRQMLKEGWIHHLLRESIATFLTRGDLWITWLSGAETFEAHMLDYEPSVSCGCWMKSSSTAFITGTIEHYNPITYGQQLDPNGDFIRHFVPEVRNLPREYIFCPWMAPLEVQRDAGCIVGTDYPHPVVDHMTAGVICMERLRSFMESLSSHQTNP